MDELGLGGEGAEAKVREAALFRSKQIARAAEIKVGLGNFESIGGLFEDAETVQGVIRAEEEAVTRVLAASDAAAQLVELCEAEPFGVEDDHQRGIRNIDSDFDDGR